MIHHQGSRAAATATQDGVASWYTPGLVDGFGDRLLMFDNTETDSLELLRFYPSLSAIAGFEEALHERVRQVGRIPDHAFPLIVAVERLDGDGALALVSTHIPGKRLSVFFDRPGPRRGLNPAFVTGIVTQIIQALTVLQSKGDDISLSTLTPDRVIITTGGRVCVVEHVLGSALRQLNLSASQLWREFGLVTPPDSSGRVRLDARTDVFQLGVIALEMLMGRRLTPQDLKDRLPDLLDQWSDAVARAGLASDRLRLWLERALQIGDRGYGTAVEAYADLRDVPSESTASAFESLMGDVDDISTRRPVLSERSDVRRVEAPALSERSEARRVEGPLQPLRQLAAQEPVMANAPAPSDLPLNTPAPARPAWLPPDNRWQDTFAAADTRTPSAPSGVVKAEPAPPPAPPTLAVPTPAPEPPVATRVPVAPARAVQTRAAERRTALKIPPLSPWVAAALGLVAFVEGGVIALLLTRQPAAAAPPVETTPVAEASVASVRTPIPEDAVRPASPATDQKLASTPRPADPIAAAAANQRSGGVIVQTPIELKVLQGDKVLGSTADGPIVLTAGSHQLDLLNTALGVRLRQQVLFRAGQITKLSITLPMGRVSVNAQPWAEVSIDSRSYGETPLANLSVPIGEHEFVFRHPDLGERRQTVTVRADQLTRVSTTFER